LTLTILPDTRVPNGMLFTGVTYDDVLSIDPNESKRVWAALGGPKSASAKLLTAPSGNSKSSKSQAPEYMLHLLPHRQVMQLQGPFIADAKAGLASLGLCLNLDVKVNVCPWSCAGCRKHCLVSAGRGAFHAVIKGRLMKTMLATYFPAHFLALLRHELNLIAKHKPNAWVRPNGTSDIPVEMIQPTRMIMKESGLRYGDYTKASPLQRPDVIDMNYTLARSAWPGRQTADEAVDLWRAGHNVSIVVDEFEPLADIPGVVSADATDEWIFEPYPTLGVLKAKGSLRKDPTQVYQFKEILDAVSNHA
jgi:hypothetical protein